MFGMRPDGSEVAAPDGSVRLAIRGVSHSEPRRLSAVMCWRSVAARERLSGYAIRWQPPAMRHFTAKFVRWQAKGQRLFGRPRCHGL